jgi:hypothetical protein
MYDMEKTAADAIAIELSTVQAYSVYASLDMLEDSSNR